VIKHRLIFVLYYKNGFFYQSRNFKLQLVGDINWLFNNYGFNNIYMGIDELIFINLSNGNDDIILKDFHVLRSNLSIPITIAGGITNIGNVDDYFIKFGADKVSINSSVWNNTINLNSISKIYGQQSVTVSLDVKKVNNELHIFNWKKQTTKHVNLDQLIETLNKLSCGEVFINDVTRDGTGFGIDSEIATYFNQNLSKPLIYSGGIGTKSHILEYFVNFHFNTLATGNLFNFLGNQLIDARIKCLAKGVNLSHR
jgi:cyclase